MTGLPVVARNLTDASNVHCLYCGTLLVDADSGSLPEPCPHVLFRADSEAGFGYVGPWAARYLTDKGYQLAQYPMEWSVVAPGESSGEAEGDDGEWDETDPYLALAQQFDVPDGLLVVDVFPEFSGGGAMYLALAGPEGIDE